MFKFRLQPLQKIRENVRRDRQMELTKALEAEAIIREKLEEVKKEIVATKEEGRRIIASGEINIDFLMGLRRHEAFLIAQQEAINEKLNILLEEIERRRHAVIEADKEVRMLEKLHDKLKERHNTELEAKEIVNMDEIASQKAARTLKMQKEQ